jgi:hypothetical protein
MIAFIRAFSTFIWLLVVRSAWTIGAIRGYAWLFKLDTVIPAWFERHHWIGLGIVLGWLFFTYILWDAKRAQLKAEYDSRRRQS